VREVEEEAPTNLRTALRERASSGAGGGTRNGDLGGLSKQELDERAPAAGVEGRSKMTKAELVRALRRAA
jgi:DNA end-binding protein Ku